MTVLSGPQMAALAAKAGFRGDALVLSLAIAKAESGWRVDAVSKPNTDGTIDRGLWQINDTHKLDRARLISDPDYNARAAYDISRGGTTFQPWTTYNNGAYRQFMSEARAAVAGVSSATGQAAAVSPAGQFRLDHPEAVDVTGNLFLSPPTPDPNITELAFPADGRRLYVGDPGLHVTSGALDLTLGQASQLTATFVDPECTLLNSRRFDLYQRFRAAGNTWEVSALEVDQGEGDGCQLTVTAQPETVAFLRRSATLTPQQNVSPSSFVERVASALQMSASTQPTASQSSIGSEMVDDPEHPGQQVLETAWQVCERLAAEAGFLFGESNGRLIFGSPAFLRSSGAAVELLARGAAPTGRATRAVRAIGVPKCRISKLTTKFVGGAFLTTSDVEVTASVLRPDGQFLRPGQVGVLQGVPRFSGQPWVVTAVGVDLADPNALVRVTLTDLPDLPSTPGSAAASTPAASPATSAQVGGSTTLYGPRGPRLDEHNVQRAQLFGPPADTARLVTLDTPWGVKVQAHRAIAARFTQACKDAAAATTWRPVIIASYSNRFIENFPTIRSLHAWGLAFDFFDTASVSGADLKGPNHAPPPAFREAFKRNGFYVGAEFSTTKDYPHIEWASAPPTR